LLNLGNAYASVGLDHTEFDRGVQHVGTGVDTIIGHLSRIGDVVIGVTLAQSLEGLLSKLGEMPRKLVSLNAEMETIGLGMAAHLENASKLVAGTIEGAGDELAEATHKESLRLERVVQNMKDAQEDLARRRGETLTRQGVLSGETESAVTRASASHEERLGEIVRSQRNAATDFQDRNASAFQTMSRQLRDYNERWAEGTAERSRVFNQSVADLAANHGRALAKLSTDMGDAATQFQDKIADAASNAATRLDDLTQKHSQAVANTGRDIVRSEQNYSQDLLMRQTRLGDQIRDIGEKYADATKHVTEEGAKAAEDFAQRVQDIQANASHALEGMRISEAQATLRFQFGQRQLQRQLSRASTPDARAELQDRLQYTQAEEALRQQAAQRSISDAENRRRREIEAAEKTLRETRQKGEEHVQAEAEQRARQVRNALEAYSREVAIAARAHGQQVEDLHNRLNEEQSQYHQQTVAIAREHATQVRNAERSYAQRVENTKRSIADENAQYEQQTDKLSANYAARNEQAATQRSRQIRDAEEQYQREVESATKAYNRVSEENANRAERETRAYAQHLDDVDRRAADSRQRIEDDAAHAEVIFERRNRDLEIQYAEAERAFRSRYEDAAGDILARNSQVANLFSKSWIEATNAVLKAQDETNGGPPGGRQNYFTETSDIMERQQQIMKVLREESFKLPGTFQQIAKSAQQMMGFGLDPFEKGLYRIVSGLSLLPGAANVGTEGVIRAFGQLRAGATGQAERVFREIGVPLRQIPGLVFNAAGQLQTELPKAWGIVLDYFGPKTDVILRNYEQSWVVLTSNLQELFENLMRIAGEPLFKNTKAFLQTLYVDIVQHGPEIQAAAARIGEGLGNFVSGIYNFIVKVTDPRTLGFLEQLRVILGRTVENVQTFVSGVAEALSGVNASSGLGNFVRDTLRLVERISSVFADPQMIRSISLFLVTLGEAKDEALRIIGDFVAGIAGVARSDAQGGLQEFVQNLTAVVLKIKQALQDVSADDARRAATTIVEFARNIGTALVGLVGFLREHGDELKALGTVFIGFKVGEAAFGFLSFFYRLIEVFRIAGPMVAGVMRLQFVITGLVTAIGGLGTALVGAVSSFGVAITTFRTFLPFATTLGARMALLGATILPALTTAVLDLAAALGTALVGSLATVAAALGLSGPVGIAVVAITALIVGLTVAWLNNWGDIQGKTAAVVDFFNDEVLPRMAAFRDGFLVEMQKIGDDVGVIAEGLKAVWDAVVGPWIAAFGKLHDQIVEWFDANGADAQDRAGKFVQGIFDGLAAAIGLFFPETWVAQLLGKAIYDKLKEFWDGLGEDQKKWVTDAFKSIPISIIKWITGASLIESLADVTRVMTGWVKGLDGTFKTALKDVIISAFSLAFGGLAPLVNEALHKVYGSGILGEWLDRLAVQGPSRIEDIAGRMGANFGRIADGIDGVVDRSNASLSGLGAGINQEGGARMGGFGPFVPTPAPVFSQSDSARYYGQGQQITYDPTTREYGLGPSNPNAIQTGASAAGNGQPARAFGPLAYTGGQANIGNLGSIGVDEQGLRYQVVDYGGALTRDPLDFTGPGGTFGVFRQDDGSYRSQQIAGRPFDVKGGVSPWAYGYGGGGSGGGGGSLDTFYDMIAGQGSQSQGLIDALGTVRSSMDMASVFAMSAARATTAAAAGGDSAMNMLKQATGGSSGGAPSEAARLRSSASGVVPGSPGTLGGYSKPPGGTPGYNDSTGGEGGSSQINNFNNPTFNDSGVDAVGALVGETWRQFRTP
jgi:hypothetical protein